MRISLQRALIISATILNASTFAQGIIQFQNRDPAAGIDAPIYWTGDPLVKVDGSDPLFRAALLGGPKGSDAASPGYAGQLRMLASPNTGATWVGFMSGPDTGYLNVGTDTARTVPDVGWGEWADVQIVAWRGNYTTWEEACNAYKSDPNVNLATSAPMDYQLPFTPSDDVKLRGLRSFGFFQIIPEPSTAMLMALGAFMFVASRRR